MYKYSEQSAENLATAHKDLQTIFNEVIKYYDCTILCGHRPVSEQLKLYKQGRTEAGRIVTNKDGVNKKSMHNYEPSLAVDAVPYPIDWNDTDRMKMFIGFVLGIAKVLKDNGEITHDIRTGIDWDGDGYISDEQFLDHPHFEIV